MYLIKNLFFSATAKTLAGMLIGRLFVGAGMGLGPPVASLYVTEVSNFFYFFLDDSHLFCMFS